MGDIGTTIAELWKSILPAGARLPDPTFAMPHWIYWVSLVILPLAAMYLVRREERRGSIKTAALPIAFLLWLGGGFAGLHCFYLRRNLFALVYLVLFALVIVGNVQTEQAVNSHSEARNEVSIAKAELRKAEGAKKSGAKGAEARLGAAKHKLGAKQTVFRERAEDRASWRAFSAGFALIIALLLLVDAVRMPWLVKRCREAEADQPLPEVRVIERGVKRDEREDIETWFTLASERFNVWWGQFVAYWAVIAVGSYYYEVLARYVFNAPTNWAHEAMFLMFGMQYLLAGAYAYREEAHVRVDIFYEKWSTRGRAIVDLITSLFFFLFTVMMLITGTLFALQSIETSEISLDVWQVEHWPVKIVLALGALLLVIQGLAKFIKDWLYLYRTSGPRTRFILRLAMTLGLFLDGIYVLWRAVPHVVGTGKDAPARTLAKLIAEPPPLLSDWFWPGLSTLLCMLALGAIYGALRGAGPLIRLRRGVAAGA